MNFLKKYWGILLAVVAAIFVGATLTKNSENGKQKRKIKKDIKETDKQIDIVKKQKAEVEREREAIAAEIDASEKRVGTLKDKIEKVDNNSTDVNEAINHLKNIGK
jgi:septal ring factor EnvC (AmiA/AmiB activator)